MPDYDQLAKDAKMDAQKAESAARLYGEAAVQTRHNAVAFALTSFKDAYPDTVSLLVRAREIESFLRDGTVHVPKVTS
ncbi:hypothetical protein [Streptomyces sp. NPDC055085]